MKSTKVMLLGFAVLTMMSAFVMAKPASAAPFHATSVGVVTATGGQSSDWRHHHRHYHRHRGAVILRF